MSKDKINVSIGILAYNEADVIGKTLQSLFEQSLFKSEPMLAIEMVVIPNGCTDNTAAIARATLDELSSSLGSHLSWRVCEVKQAGLANAWNRFIHDFSSPDADYLIVMSADIQFLDSQTLRSLVEVLETQPEAWVSVDKRIKDVALKQNKNIREQLSALVSGLSGGNNTKEGEAAWISGQLSCTRAKVLRQIWLPTTLPTDDAFLYTAIVTDRLTTAAEPKRVILAGSASHVFESYTDIRRLLRHEKWLIFGQAVNELLYADLLANSSEQQDVCLLIKQRNEQNPLWLNQLVQTAAKKGGWLIPRFILSRRFQSLLRKPLPKAVLLSPLAIAAFAIDLWLSIQVNSELHSKGGVGYWQGSGGWGKSS